MGGAVIAATDELAEELTWWANCIGATGAPFDSGPDSTLMADFTKKVAALDAPAGFALARCHATRFR